MCLYGWGWLNGGGFGGAGEGQGFLVHAVEGPEGAETDVEVAAAKDAEEGDAHLAEAPDKADGDAAGHVPGIGESVEYERYRLTVVSGDERRVNRVRIDLLPPDEASPQEDQQPLEVIS